MSGIIYPINNKTYSAEDVEIYNCTRTSGVFSGSDFDISLNGNKLTVGKGLAWIKNADFSGKAVAFTTSEVKTLPSADSSNDRYDVLAIRYDATKTEPQMVIIKGNPSSSPKIPTRSTETYLYELFLYAILRKKGETTASDDNITDLRENPDYCGVMKDAVSSAVAPYYEKIAESLSVGDKVVIEFDNFVQLYAEVGGFWRATIPLDVHTQTAFGTRYITGYYKQTVDGSTYEYTVEIKGSTGKSTYTVNKIEVKVDDSVVAEFSHIYYLWGTAKEPRGYVKVDDVYNPTSHNAQSGVALAEAIENSVDDTYNPESEKSQSGIAVAEAIRPFKDLMISVPGGNLFNVNAEKKNASELSSVEDFEGIIEGASFNYLGQFKINASAFITPLIPVKNNGVYTTLFATQIFGNTMLLALYDVEKKFLGAMSITNTEEKSYFTQVTFDISTTTITPSSVDRSKIAYARTFYMNSTTNYPYMEKYMFVEGYEYPEDYLNYGKDVYKPKVDQSYNPESKNPQSGKALAEAIENLKEEINEEENETETPALLVLPEQYDLVAGDTFELFYKGIINAINTDIYGVEISFSDKSSIGKSFRRKYIYTPEASDVGVKTMQVNLIDNVGTVIDTKTIKLNIIETPTSPTSNKIVLCIGDSLTEKGIWVNELNRRLTGVNGTPSGNGLSNIQFIGTQNKAGTKYEGYGGWSYRHYLGKGESAAYMFINGTFSKTDNDQHSVYKDANNVEWKLETISSTKIKIIRVSSSGTLPTSGTLTWVSGGSNTDNIVYTSSEQAPGNPFWNESTNDVDFASYVQKQGVSSIDYVYILLGWNDIGWSFSTFETRCKQFIDKILAEYPNCKIGLVGLQVPSRDGIAFSYGVQYTYSFLLDFAFKVNKFYKELVKEDAYKNNVDFINLAGQFDSEYSYNTIEQLANVRTTQKETVQSNGLHPSSNGSMQIADAVYRNICTKIS